MVFSQLLIFICLPNFGSKLPCLKGLIRDENEGCQLFRRPRMYVQKRKYISIDDFSIEAITVYEDIMKQGNLDLPWDALAAYTAPWDPHEIYQVRRTPDELYPIRLKSKKELSSPPLGNIPLKHVFMPKDDENFIKYQGENENSLRIDKSYQDYLATSWPVILAALFEVLIKLFSEHFPGKIQVQNYLDDVNTNMKRKVLKPKRKLRTSLLQNTEKHTLSF